MKDKYLTVRVLDADYEALKLFAKNQDITLSDWVRLMLGITKQ